MHRLKDLDDQWLIKTHFFGIYREDEETGEVYLPDPQNPSRRLERSVLQASIEFSIQFFEELLDVAIRPQERITEYHPFDQDLYNDYMLVNLRKYPVTQVHSLELVYGENGPTIWEIPSALIQLHGAGSKFGMVNVLPMWGVANNYDPAYSLLFPGVVKAQHAPSIIKVVYDAGMELVKKDDLAVDIPETVVRAIGLRAAIHPFNILGDIVIGAGIASISASVDGVSQSINTTSSAENAAFSSRIIMHRKELFGEQGIPGLVQTLQKQWRRPVLGLL